MTPLRPYSRPPLQLHPLLLLRTATMGSLKSNTTAAGDAGASRDEVVSGDAAHAREDVAVADGAVVEETIVAATGVASAGDVVVPASRQSSVLEF
jgi:imidazoleglycerol phosphate dehydratase HisB